MATYPELHPVLGRISMWPSSFLKAPAAGWPQSAATLRRWNGCGLRTKGVIRDALQAEQ